MLSKGRPTMTLDQLTCAARNFAHGRGTRSTFEMAGSIRTGPAWRSYRQVVHAQRLQMLLPVSKRKEADKAQGMIENPLITSQALHGLLPCNGVGS
jgi:hypothetical protein